jgi:hypothetical protein
LTRSGSDFRKRPDPVPDPVPNPDLQHWFIVSVSTSSSQIFLWTEFAFKFLARIMEF